MGRWTGAAKAGVTAAKGGRLWRRANKDADRLEAEGPTDAGASSRAPFDVRLAPEEALLLARYIGGRAALGRIAPFGIGKYVFLVAALALLFLTDASPAFAAVFVGIFVVAAVVQWLLTRAVRRFGALDELSGLENATSQVKSVWWPNLQRELRRVGISPRPWALLRLGAAHVSRRATAEQRTALTSVDWLAVMPLDEWREARRQLAEAAGRTPPPNAAAG